MTAERTTMKDFTEAQRTKLYENFLEHMKCQNQINEGLRSMFMCLLEYVEDLENKIDKLKEVKP